jgi:hypothetical protein
MLTREQETYVQVRWPWPMREVATDAFRLSRWNGTKAFEIITEHTAAFLELVVHGELSEL